MHRTSPPNHPARAGAGDAVLLRAASLGRPPYVARLQAVRAPPGGPPEAVMRWFYRLPDVQARPALRARPARP